MKEFTHLRAGPQLQLQPQPRWLHLPWRRLFIVLGVLLAVMYPVEALVQTALVRPPRAEASPPTSLGSPVEPAAPDAPAAGPPDSVIDPLTTVPEFRPRMRPELAPRSPEQADPGPRVPPTAPADPSSGAPSDAQPGTAPTTQGRPADAAAPADQSGPVPSA